MSKKSKSTHAWGIAGLVLGILGLLLFLAPYIGIVLSITAVVFYAIQHKREPTGAAMGGLVTGILGTVLNGFMLFIFLIGALAYFGALSPQELLPDKCTFPPGLVCEEYSVSTTGGVQFIVSNGMGKTVSITKVAVADASAPNVELCSAAPAAVVDNRERSGTLGCIPESGLNAGSKQKLNVKVTYKFGNDPASATALDYAAEGEIYATVPVTDEGD